MSPLPAVRLGRGIAYLIIAVSLVPIMDGIAKYLTGFFPIAQITWGRYALALALIMPVAIWRYGASSLLVADTKLQLLRGLFLVAATYSFFLVLKFLPLAETLALAFVYPLIVTALSPIFLGEQVGWRRYTAVAAGFSGALFIIQPGSDLFRPIALLGLLPGCFFAGYIILTRKLAGRAPALVTLCYGTIIGAVLLTVWVPAVWIAPSTIEWLLLASLGAIASISHLLIIKAYEAAPASLLAPLGYAEMPMAVLVGYVAFAEWPGLSAWLGIAIIIGSGIFISLRESRRS